MKANKINKTKLALWLRKYINKQVVRNEYLGWNKIIIVLIKTDADAEE